MSARLCQQCCQWIWSRDGLCPDCQDLLPESYEVEKIAQRARGLTGAVLRPIGHVKLKRKKLPTDGVLYVTETGLFFLPHRMVLATKYVEEQSTSLLWRIAAVIWMPLWFFLPLVRRKRLRAKVVQEASPIQLNGSDLQLLPDLLPRVPGAFFIPAREVAVVRDRRRQWIVERFAGPNVVIEPVSPDAFRKHLAELGKIDLWRMAFGAD